MNKVPLSKLFEWVERLRKEITDEPAWVNTTQGGTYEFKENTVEVAVVLKLTRIAQGIVAMRLLCLQGLFVDMGAIYRGVTDCDAEIYFMLENYPELSPPVQKFLKHFFAHTMETYLTHNENSVETKKIHAARARILSQSTQNNEVLAIITRIYKTFSGYVHANYAHLMQMYGGRSKSFKLTGIPEESVINEHLQFVEVTKDSLAMTLVHIANKFGRVELEKEMRIALGLANKTGARGED